MVPWAPDGVNANSGWCQYPTGTVHGNTFHYSPGASIIEARAMWSCTVFTINHESVRTAASASCTPVTGVRAGGQKHKQTRRHAESVPVTTTCDGRPSVHSFTLCCPQGTPSAQASAYGHGAMSPANLTTDQGLPQ